MTKEPRVPKVPTVREVAARAGVSAMTVSNVLNAKRGKVSPETVERVRKAMDELGFVRNAPASALKSRRSDIVALVYPSNPEPLANPHDAAFLGAVECEVSGRGRHLMIWAAKDVAGTAENLRTWKMDGAILYGTFGGEVDDLHRRLQGVPLVFVDNYSDSPDVRRVGVDDRGGGELAARHLLDRGHRRLGFVGPPIGDVGVVRERYDGFAAVAAEYGVREQDIRRYECNPRFEDGWQRARLLCAEREEDRPTGLFATADIIAVGMLNGFRSKGIDVPGQVSVIGFDDIPQAEHGLPALSTIHQDVAKKAREAVEMLIRLIEHPEASDGQVTLEVELVERDTVRRLAP